MAVHARGRHAAAAGLQRAVRRLRVRRPRDPLAAGARDRRACTDRRRRGTAVMKIAVLAVLAFCLLAANADAAQYSVSACTVPYGANHLFVASGPAGGCNDFGLWTQQFAPQPARPVGSLPMTAPPGTTISAYSTIYAAQWTSTFDGEWTTQLDAGSGAPV